MSETEKSLEQVEKEEFTRRQALRKFGFGAGLSAFMLLGVDDLARMVGEKMQRLDGDNKVANQIAKEFQSAGIAFASGPSGGPSNCPQLFCDCLEVGPDGWPPGWTQADWIQHCVDVNDPPPACSCPGA